MTVSNLNDITPLIMMLIRKYKKLNEQSLTRQRRLATVGINYLYILIKYFKNSDKIAFKILAWLENLTADPELCLLKELTLYFHLIYTNNSQALEIKKLLKQSNYKKISDNYESIAFVNIYDNGKIVKCSSLKNRNFVRPIEVDPQVFEDHTSTNNSTYLTVNKKLLNKNKAVSSDPTWIRLIKNLAKRSKYPIAILSLFKLDHEYYIFIKYNAGLSDDGTLYKYDGKFKKVCTLDSNQIIALRKSN